MNPWWLIGVATFWLGLKFLKPNALVWLMATAIGSFVFLKYGVNPPLPSSILGMFMAIILGALALYGTTESDRYSEIEKALRNLVLQKKFRYLLILGLLVLPILFGISAYQQANQAIAPPPSGRTIHPAPPSEIIFRGQKMDLIQGVNPYRELESKDSVAFRNHILEGRTIYYQNCVFCHGDDLEGKGIFSHGLDPAPANFQDPTTIAMLQESYLFWRIAKGGPGLPSEGTPWFSAMPAWEDRLTEKQIWDVILFLYDYTGRKPRARDHQ